MSEDTSTSDSERLSTVERLHLNARKKEGWGDTDPPKEIWDHIAENGPVEQDEIESEWGRRGLKSLRELMRYGYISYDLDWRLQAEGDSLSTDNRPGESP